jgi:CMP-N-acetylneuraminic acid synthetase
MITAFLPCRRGSQRVPDKNIREFSGVTGGLLSIKLNQLLSCENIDSIVVSSNDDRVLDFTQKLTDSRVVVDIRPDCLGSSSTTTDDLIKYVPSIIKEGHVLWTHVTSPFINQEDYSNIIDVYIKQLDLGFDSLMTVLKLQGFIWDESKPVSYDRSTLKWPMTQNIQPLYEVDSGVFMSSIENYKRYDDRIGNSPFLFVQEKLKSVDIDWPEDFTFAEELWKSQC